MFRKMRDGTWARLVETNGYLWFEPPATPVYVHELPFLLVDALDPANP
jgi:hypothetical protein